MKRQMNEEELFAALRKNYQMEYVQKEQVYQNAIARAAEKQKNPRAPFAFLSRLLPIAMSLAIAMTGVYIFMLRPPEQLSEDSENAEQLLTTAATTEERAELTTASVTEAKRPVLTDAPETTAAVQTTAEATTAQLPKQTTGAAIQTAAVVVTSNVTNYAAFTTTQTTTTTAETTAQTEPTTAETTVTQPSTTEPTVHAEWIALKAENLTVSPGDTATLNIRLADVSTFGGFQMCLRLRNVQTGEILPAVHASILLSGSGIANKMEDSVIYVLNGNSDYDRCYAGNTLLATYSAVIPEDAAVGTVYQLEVLNDDAFDSYFAITSNNSGEFFYPSISLDGGTLTVGN